MGVRGAFRFWYESQSAEHSLIAAMILSFLSRRRLLTVFVASPSEGKRFSLCMFVYGRCAKTGEHLQV
jgi:hypothetical protein